MRAVIMAGGKGTRIKSVNQSLPKALIPVAGKPVMERQLLSLKQNGVTEIIVIAGHLNERLRDYFGDGTAFGVSIEYIVEEEPLGTAGGLFYLKGRLEDDFLLINCDLVFNVDLERFMRFHKDKKAAISILAHPNSHPYDSVLIDAQGDGMVKAFMWKELERPVYYRNLTNAGIHILSPETLEGFTAPARLDLDRQLISRYIQKGSVYAYATPEYVADMGTPERLEAAERACLSGRAYSRSLTKKQKCIFLDRDGVINKLNGFIAKHEDFEMIEEAYEAIRLINQSEYLCIVITNQPVLARGECSYEELELIHMKMETLLGGRGCYVDGLYYCPHHPDKGFPGEIEELKTDCDCRKPKTGLFVKAQKDFNIEFSESFMIGDSDRDIEAAAAIGATPCRVGAGGETGAVLYGRDILEIVMQILRKTNND